MKVLITGAFGNLGLMCVQQAIELGHQVTCFDLDTPNNRRVADRLNTVTTVFGDLRNTAALEPVINEVDAIIHNASLLPPVTEDKPDFAASINVDACKALIALAERSTSKPRFIFPSSVTVYGHPTSKRSLKTANDPVLPTDNYTHHKVAIEEALRSSNLDWVVLRVGVSVDARTLGTDRKTLKGLLAVDPDNPLEYVHPKDVAFAMCKAYVEKGAIGKILLIGGGPTCQITQHTFMSTAFRSLGLQLPRSALGNMTFYTHWMDTSESQRILQFQRHGFEDYTEEMRRKLTAGRYLAFPFRWFLNRLIPVIL